MPTGFMSERTAEYVLVPDIVHRLSQKFSKVVPLFYWATREGTAKVGYLGKVRLVAAYARRPKVFGLGEPVITMKINELLIRHAEILGTYSVPVFAGVPCVSQLSDHTIGAQCAWFMVGPHWQTPGDALVDIDIRGPEPVVLGLLNAPLQGPLSTDDLVALSLQYSAWMTWSDAFEVIKDSARRLAGHPASFRSSWFGQFIPYKPFFLLLMHK